MNDVALSVDQKSYLPAGNIGTLGDIDREIGRNRPVFRYASSVNPLERFKIALFQTCRVTQYRWNNFPPENICSIWFLVVPYSSTVT